MSRTLPRHLRYKHGAYYYDAIVHGKRTWKRLGTDYGQALREWAELEGRETPSLRTLADAIGRYLADSTRRLRPSTLAAYEQNAKMILPVLGALPLDGLKREHVYEYVRRRGNVSGNRERALISATYTWALNAGLFHGQNPAAGLRYRNTERIRDRYITDAELDRLVLAAKGRWQIIIRFAYATALRQGDIIALTLLAATDEGVLVRISKTGKRLLIGWSDEVRALWRQAAGMRIGAQPLFPARGGGHYTKGGFKAEWRKIKLRAGLPDIHFHDVRKKSSSDFEDERDANALLDHADPRTTHKIYRVKPVAVKPAL